MSELISDLRKVPVIRPVIPFVAGLLIMQHFGFENGSLFVKAVPALLGCLVVLSALGRGRRFWGLVTSGIVFSLSFMLLGILHHAASRSYRVDEMLLDRQEGYLEGVVTEGAAERQNSWLVRLHGKAFISDSLRLELDEFVQVYLPGDDGLQDLLPGQHLLVWGRLDRIRNHGNPGEFDYAGYMSRKRTRFNLFVREKAYYRILTERKTAPGYGPARLRQRIIRGWNRADPDVAVLSALTLGYKKLLDRETKSAFSDAGAMHLLAVSGLHVGMIWWILEKLIRVPGNRSAWRYFKQLLIISVLWGYAAVTGFSDSVTRSVTMFSLLALSRSIHRNSNIYNTLLLSAFLLLALKPSRILEPGFQLSYLAVAGIVTIQPRLEIIYSGIYWPFKRVLDLVSVSIAAQVSTLPLVLTYFHQFPVWFLLTNLMAIPLVSIILALFVLFVPLFIFFPQWTIFSHVLLWITGVLNKVVTGIAALPGAVIADVMPDPAVMMLFLLLLNSTCMFVYYKRAHLLTFSMLLLSMALFLPLYREHQLAGRSSVTVFNISDATLISCLHGRTRATCFLPIDTVPGPYLLDYVQSLSGIPPGIKSHRVLWLSENDSPAYLARNRIAEGLWAIRWGKWDVLIAGDCDQGTLQHVIRSFDWQMIICRRGIPLYGWGETFHNFTGRMVGDGTLRKYEMDQLREQVPALWLAGEKGALVIAQQKDALPLTDYPL